MSLAEDYSRQSRSYYNRSSSFGNLHELSSNYNSSNLHRTSSSAVIERNFLPRPSLAWDYSDDSYYFHRRSSRFIDDIDRRLQWRVYDDLIDREFFKHDSLGFERSLPLGYREYQNSTSTTRTVPIHYTPITTVERREKIYKKLDDYNDWSSSSFRRNDESYHSRESNHLTTDNWSSKQDIEYSDSSRRQRRMSIPDYSSSTRINFH